MVKIINGAIVTEGADPVSGGDSSRISLCGFSLPKWMPLVWIGAAFLIFGIRGALLVGGATFIAYTLGNSGRASSASTQQVMHPIYSFVPFNIYAFVLF